MFNFCRKVGANGRRLGQQTTILRDPYNKFVPVAAVLLCTDLLKRAVNIARRKPRAVIEGL